MNPSTTSSRIFLLGGQDLEMHTIRQLLQAQGEDFLDLGLAWGARLSDYAGHFQDLEAPSLAIYGIELTEDVAAPQGYHAIDHHNDRPHTDAALAQVAALLGVTLDRWQQLVVANDHGFIPAMQAMGASAEEIAAVRLADRRAQGITEEDEALAEQSIRDHKECRDGVTLVRSLGKIFTPVADRMHVQTKRLLVWRDEKLTYYGKGVPLLVAHFQDWIQDKRAYHGGGDEGYFGLDEKQLQGDIRDHIATILQVLRQPRSDDRQSSNPSTPSV